MSKEQNLQVVRRGYELFGQGNIDGMLQLMHDQVDWITPGPEELPTAGTRRGHAGVVEFFQALNGGFQFEGFAPKTFLAEGNMVVVLGESIVRFRTTGKLMPPVEWVHIFRLEDGKIVHFQEIYDGSLYVDEMRALQQRA